MAKPKGSKGPSEEELLPPGNQYLDLLRADETSRRRRSGWLAAIGALILSMAGACFLTLDQVTCDTTARTEIVHTKDSAAGQKEDQTRSTVDEQICHPGAPYFPLALSILGLILIAPWVMSSMPGESSFEAFGTKVTNSGPRISSTSLTELAALNEAVEKKKRQR